METIYAPTFTAAEHRSVVTEEYCFVCSRCTDHFGEHSDAQILAALGRTEEAANLAAHCYTGIGHTLNDAGYACKDCGEFMLD